MIYAYNAVSFVKLDISEGSAFSVLTARLNEVEPELSKIE